MPPTPQPWRMVVDQINLFGPVCKVVGALSADGIGDDIALITTSFGQGGRAIERGEWLANGVLMAAGREMFDALVEILAAFATNQGGAARQAEATRRVSELVLRLRREGGV